MKASKSKRSLKLNKSSISKQQPEETEQQGVFTEEDFKNFEQEYKLIHGDGE